MFKTTLELVKRISLLPLPLISEGKEKTKESSKKAVREETMQRDKVATTFEGQ